MMSDMLRSGVRTLAVIGCSVFVVLLNGGCATIVKGTSQTARFETDPAGATVRMSGQVLGTTPCDATFKKKAIGVVEFALDGYQTRFVNPNLEGKIIVEPTFYANLLWILTVVGAPIGIGGACVDYFDGAYYSLETPFSVSLYPVGSQVPQSPSPFTTPSPTSSQVQEQSAANKSSADRLKELTALKDQGTITQEEYEQKRKAILSEL